MNVESTNILSLLPSNSMVEGASLPLTNDVATLEDFSEALLAQIELLMGVKEGSQSPLQAQTLADSQNINLQDLAGLLGSKKNVRELAALLGKDLPATDTLSDADNLSATLDAVTGALKYMAASSTDEEKIAEAEQNMKDVIALAAETEQSMKDVAVINDAPVQMNASLANSDLDKEAKSEGQDQIASAAEDIGVQEEPVAAIVLPPVVLAEQQKIDNKVVQDDAVKEKVLSSFVKPFAFTEGSKLSLSQKNDTLDNAPQQEAGSRQSAQDKQSFNLEYLENAEQAEKTGQIERQPLSLEADKVSSRVVGDIVQLNRPAADNKADVPAIAKPLSHQEWNKDLGDRIVWMNNRAIPTAEIKMNPQHLGPISVRIDVNQDHQANIVFTAQHAVVREALEASIPKLREMMSAQQLNLVDVSISQNSTSGQGQPQPQSFAQMADGGGRHGKGAEGMIADEISGAMEDVENGQAVVSKGLLSLYA